MRNKRVSLVGQGYAIPGFNVNNIEDVRAVIDAAEELRSPVILLVTEGALRYAGHAYLSAVVRAAREEATVPVHIQLDHGSSLEAVVRCIQAGFDSVMIDGSPLPFAENVALTRRVVEVAHACGVWVEGEIGVIPGTEDDIHREDEGLTPPEQAIEFAQLTGVDALAAAVGTAHGFYKARPKIDLPRIQAMRAGMTADLALHGGSDVEPEQIQASIAAGMNKVNVGTEVKAVFAQTLREALMATPDSIDARKALTAAREATKTLVMAKMQMVGSVGRADG